MGWWDSSRCEESPSPTGWVVMSIIQGLAASTAAIIVVPRKVAGPTGAESSEHWRISPTHGFHRIRRDTVGGFWCAMHNGPEYGTMIGAYGGSLPVNPEPSGRMVCPYEYQPNGLG